VKTVTVVGTGAIGTSVALALSRRGLTVHLEDVNTTAVRTAEAMGAGSVGTPAERVDLAVIAVPPAHTGSVLEQLQRRGVAHAYTDVASVKTRPYDDLRLAGAEPSSFIGGHPLAGTERSGPLAARADVFEDRPWILTPSARTDQSVLNRALELVSLCSGVPVIMDPLVHDRTLALTSHAPQLIFTLMAATLVDATEADIRVAGQGLRNVADPGGGAPELWRDIFTANADALADVLDAYAADLGRAVGALRALGHADDEVRERAEGELETLLRHGHRGRARVAGPASGVPAEVRLSVALSDRPGTLARLFGAVEELGGRIEDVRLENAQGLPYGSVSLSVPQTSVADLSQKLRAGGWATLMVALPDVPQRATRPAESRDPIAVEVRTDGTG
jgi:prephenate dehydrogenase